MADAAHGFTLVIGEIAHSIIIIGGLAATVSLSCSLSKAFTYLKERQL